MSLRLKLMAALLCIALAVGGLQAYFWYYRNYYSVDRYEDVLTAWAVVALASGIAVIGLLLQHAISRSSRGN